MSRHLKIPPTTSAAAVLLSPECFIPKVSMSHPDKSRLETYCSVVLLPSKSPIYRPPHYGEKILKKDSRLTIEISSVQAGHLIGAMGVDGRYEIEKIRDQLPEDATITISQRGPSIRTVTIVASSSVDVAVVEELVQAGITAPASF